MEVRQLNTLIRAAQFQSFSKAAESLGYSQSAVTVQIKALEEELAEWLGYSRALLFISGFAANQAVIADPAATDAKLLRTLLPGTDNLRMMA